MGVVIELLESRELAFRKQKNSVKWDDWVKSVYPSAVILLWAVLRHRRLEFGENNMVGERVLRFRSNARLVDTLGQQLIPNNGVGLSELVKNCYDADAENVSIHLGKAFDRDRDERVMMIVDDGQGMDIDALENKFFEIAHNHDRPKKTSKFGRTPVGEKGIGRFAVQRLGRFLDLYTKTEGGTEWKVEVDWDDFSDEKKLSEVGITATSDHEPKMIPTGHGTILLIKSLRERFDGNHLSKFKSDIEWLVSPFVGKTDFNIDLKVPEDKETLVGSDISTVEIARQAHFSFKGEIDENGILTFTYTNNHPWSKKNGEVKTDQWGDWKESLVRNVKYDFYIYNKTKPLLAASKINAAKLRKMTGIRLFRNGLRVYPYGSNGGKGPEGDWLGITHERAQAPSKWFAEDQVIGSVNFTHSESINCQLKDKTDRSGMIENKEWEDLRRVTREIIKKLKGAYIPVANNPSQAPPELSPGVQIGLSDFAGSGEGGISSTSSPPKPKIPQKTAEVPFEPPTVESPPEIEGAREYVQNASRLISEVLRDLNMEKEDVRERIKDAEGELRDALGALEE